MGRCMMVRGCLSWWQQSDRNQARFFLSYMHHNCPTAKKLRSMPMDDAKTIINPLLGQIHANTWSVSLLLGNNLQFWNSQGLNNLIPVHFSWNGQCKASGKTPYAVVRSYGQLRELLVPPWNSKREGNKRQGTRESWSLRSPCACQETLDFRSCALILFK